ncbi:MAG: aminotransferase class I/II-fold pyridoxal phosphate-dependent enzyme [Ruminococcus sp.]|nr:aminotransferase class I/II-fold pyridoxal phosphate-dependent enzyme [Ruminococcus sp.]
MSLDEYDNNKKILDFSLNLNPLGIPHSVRKVISDERCWNAYPDMECTALRRKISVLEDVPAENIVCGNGGDDMIFRIVTALNPARAVIFSPCSYEYRRALEQNGCKITEIQLDSKDNFSMTADAVSVIPEYTGMVILGSPSNPTGMVVTPYVMKCLAEQCERNHTVLVCDERYIDFLYKNSRLSAKRVLDRHIIIVKSFTRIFSIAGIRLGYAIAGDRETAEKIRSTGQRFSISGIALAAAEKAVQEIEFMRLTRSYIEIVRRDLSGELTASGIQVFPSCANFLLIHCELPIDELLRRKGIIIKKCGAEYGLDDGYFRISLRKHDDNRRLVEALEWILRLYR